MAEFQNSEEFEKAAKELEAQAKGPDIFTPLMQAAVGMHELVLEFQKAGFSRDEAIHIVLEMVKNTAAGDD